MTRFLFVLLLAASCSGCAIHYGQPGSFSDADKLVREKKFHDAIGVYDRAAKEAAGSDRGAAALFASAELRASHDNPSRDYSASLQKFEEFLRQYPEHTRVREAQSWRHILRTVVELRKENEQLTKNIEQLKKVDIRHEERRTGK